MKPGLRSKADQAVCTAVRLVLLPMVLILVLAGSVRGQALSFDFGGGSTTLTISTAIAGMQPNDATDNASGLAWTASNGQGAKITTSTSAPGQSFSLFVTVDVTSGFGSSQGEVELTDGMLDTDLVINIPKKKSGTGTLTYRARATVSQGNSADDGDDVHTITYTILAQ